MQLSSQKGLILLEGNRHEGKPMLQRVVVAYQPLRIFYKGSSSLHKLILSFIYFVLNCPQKRIYRFKVYLLKVSLLSIHFFQCYQPLQVLTAFSSLPLILYLDTESNREESQPQTGTIIIFYFSSHYFIKLITEVTIMYPKEYCTKPQRVLSQNFHSFSFQMCHCEQVTLTESLFSHM